ncbi:hypothetical protein PVNG_02457 [Plasmodium vivax North Korean]|uniref:Large ribosomal subunit protein uL29c n=1 Tax=Plasmodium vivax North Korean TaxID=1035514 RepID=A0A0J9TLY4_PLAVI|nr:hypothetical protein PVNG_02457 [Plasmodium vivax North Korean]
MLKDLRESNIEKVKEMLFKLKVKLVEYRFQSSQGSLKNTSLIRTTRKTIAQLMTILGERKEYFSNRDLAHYMKLEEEEEKKRLKKK